jgi:hypothetical protein
MTPNPEGRLSSFYPCNIGFRWLVLEHMPCGVTIGLRMRDNNDTYSNIGAYILGGTSPPCLFGSETSLNNNNTQEERQFIFRPV